MKESATAQEEKAENASRTAGAEPKESAGKLSALSLIFFTISFLGWCMETAYCSSGFTVFVDRGFLSSPFCVIYGAPLCLLYLMIGTPREGILFDKVQSLACGKGRKILICHAAYFFLSAAFASLFELIFGYAFARLGVYLWDYSDYPMNFKGLICLPFSLIWGGLITFVMAFAFSPIYRLFLRIPKRIAAAVSVFLWLIVLADFSFNFIYLLVYKVPFGGFGGVWTYVKI